MDAEQRNSQTLLVAGQNGTTTFIMFGCYLRIKHASCDFRIQSVADCPSEIKVCT